MNRYLFTSFFIVPAAVVAYLGGHTHNVWLQALLEGTHNVLLLFAGGALFSKDRFFNRGCSSVG